MTVAGSDDETLRRWARDLPALAEAAGRATLKHFRAGAEVETKADRSPVTAADREAEAIILDELAELAPEIAVVSEEASSVDGLPDEIGARFWLVDPLDGTREFIAGRDEFTVNIALIVDRIPVLGVVHLPVLGATYVGGPDGARRIAAGVERTIAVRPVPARDLVAVASRSHRSREEDEFLARHRVDNVISAGSSLKFCRVAEGAADVYPRFGPTMEWDTAAGDAVLRAAGGVVSTLDGRPLAYGKTGFRNPPFVARSEGFPLSSAA